MPNLLRQRFKQPSTRKGERVYAIGDIHGRHDLFRELIAAIVRHWNDSPRNFDRVEMVLLGDIIDRGPDSALCLRLAHDLVTHSRVHLLRGNHEDLLLKSIAGHPTAQQIWLGNGGEAFLADFGIAPPRPNEDSIDFGERIAAAVPAHYVTMLEQAPLTFSSGDYLFVHAGIRPGVRLNRQNEQDLLFIRGEFTQSDRNHGVVIVHGHSIVDAVEIHHNRIAVDTGAYASGRLSCVCLDGRRREIIHT
jgi:serine/threonine protein phosphatase 1